mmetsp:Transcript_17547/g.22331  ORF Transcript_17547/g.22331 Transcript_17547/m.22331 type:complete len:126 (-) Transcript_17547:1069-1446(-)
MLCFKKKKEERGEIHSYKCHGLISEKHVYFKRKCQLSMINISKFCRSSSYILEGDWHHVHFCKIDPNVFPLVKSYSFLSLYYPCKISQNINSSSPHNNTDKQAQISSTSSVNIHSPLRLLPTRCC